LRSLAIIVLIVAGGLTAGLARGRDAQAAQGSALDPVRFVQTIDNPYFPLYPGTTFVYQGISEGETERNTVTVTFRKKVILGVETTVVRDAVYVDGELAELTQDWYAQDRQGNVWYFGEFSQEYENGVPVSDHGSWEAGVDGAQPGIIMPAHPHVGDTYRQEYYAGEAEDMARVLALDAAVTVPYGSFTDVLVTREWTPLEPGVAEKKFYAPCVGNVLIRQVAGGDDVSRLVEIRTAANVHGPVCDE